MYLTFNLAHYLLAVKYLGIATKVPARLDGKPEQPESRFYTISYWFMLISNIVTALLFGVSITLFYSQLLSPSQSPVRWRKEFKILCSSCLAFCALTSGVLLVTGVIKIRKYLKIRNALDTINTGMLMRHALAFTIYLFAIAIWAGAEILFDIKTTITTYEILSRVIVANLVL